MGRKRVNNRKIIVNCNGELLQAGIRIDIMKHFIEEQERRQERCQEKGNGADAGNGGELYWHICEDKQGRQR